MTIKIFFVIAVLSASNCRGHKHHCITVTVYRWELSPISCMSIIISCIEAILSTGPDQLTDSVLHMPIRT